MSMILYVVFALLAGFFAGTASLVAKLAFSRELVFIQDWVCDVLHLAESSLFCENVGIFHHVC